MGIQIMPCVWCACGVASVGQAGSFGGSLMGHPEPSAVRRMWLCVLCMLAAVAVTALV